MISKEQIIAVTDKPPSFDDPPGSVWTYKGHVPIAIVFSVEQAGGAFRDYPFHMILCIDAPRAHYCTSAAAAAEFFKGRE